MTFVEKLRKLREERGLSEARLAAASGLTFSTVHQYGLGRRKPSFAAVVKLAKALDVDCTAFADCDDVQGEEAPAKKKPAAPRKPGRRPKGK